MKVDGIDIAPYVVDQYTCAQFVQNGLSAGMYPRSCKDPVAWLKNAWILLGGNEETPAKPKKSKAVVKRKD